MVSRRSTDEGAGGGNAPLHADARALQEKYRRLCHKYRALVLREREREAARSDATTLALTAMKSATSGLALLRGGRVLTTNSHWRELDEPVLTPWRPAGEPADERRYASLGRLALAEARPLASKGAPLVRVERFEQEATGRFIEVRLERLRGSGRPPYVAVTVLDVTDRVRNERELERAREAMFEQERMRSVGVLASGIAHDLNNVLHAVGIRLAKLQRAPLTPLEAENVDTLVRIVGDAASRVTRLQELARHRQDVPEDSVDLRAVIREAVELARPELEQRSRAAGTPVEVGAQIPPLPRVRGDAADLRHVFVNLLLNSRDAMPRGGEVLVRARREGDTVAVAVLDDGTGFAPEQLGRVFDPFFTTKGDKGTGLGLSIAYSVMHRLGGAITAENRAHGGAAVTLRFPVAVAEQAQPSRRAAATPLPRDRRVLVVDDDADALEAMRWVLEDLGQQVAAEPSGAGALRRLVAGERFDLVFCDIGMPEMNGWQLVERIAEIAAGTKVFMLSGWAREVAPDDPRRRRVAGLLAKPLGVDDLQQLLARELPPDAAPAVDRAAIGAVEIAPGSDEREGGESPHVAEADAEYDGVERRSDRLGSAPGAASEPTEHSAGNGGAHPSAPA